MEQSPYTPRTGVDTSAVLLPIEQRLHALQQLARLELLATERERAVLLALVLYPLDRMVA